MSRVLSRRADHKTAANLISEFSQVEKAAHSVFVAHALRMEKGVVVRVCRFVAQEISVSTGGPQHFVAFEASFSQGQGDCAVRKLCFQTENKVAENFVGIKTVFSALKNESPEP